MANQCSTTTVSDTAQQTLAEVRHLGLDVIGNERLATARRADDR